MNNDAASAQARLLLENSAKIYEKSGIIAAVSNLFAGAKTEERLLQYGGERALTNYQHILELFISSTTPLIVFRDCCAVKTRTKKEQRQLHSET